MASKTSSPSFKAPLSTTRNAPPTAAAARATTTSLGKRLLGPNFLPPQNIYPYGPPNSLAHLMTAHHRSRQRMAAMANHHKYATMTTTVRSFQDTSKNDEEVVDYGYETQVSAPPRPTKRRRMHRRNSKTPAMLMAMSASIAAAEDFRGSQGVKKMKVDGGSVTTAMIPKDDSDTRKDSTMMATVDQDDKWKASIKVAEELVLQLKLRQAPTSSATRPAAS